MNKVEKIIQSVNISPRRDKQLELKWEYIDYAVQVDELLAYYCLEAVFCDLIKVQVSQLIHQGYVLIEGSPISVPLSALMNTLESIASGDKTERKLRHISKKIGFDIQHAHFSESSFIVENWLNYARNTNLGKQPVTFENMYNSLIESTSKPNKTGEWVVYSNQKGFTKFWCLWLHQAGDDTLVENIRQHT
ncbi:hypothetical protein FM037_02950 [Shewanella psychropiezotolerans]|uniref:Uncharacterized protein n=1 Tax=Shewanella psychropiezotolerans TaxID=2593655 RepID=A0ABX5WTG7_9GAMM|nr:hypothetical protein [Shewanella psychropiezotolerans]QDO82389.1 hypothetical protein FM037_02950 [Shewanella psychropiezotolerans]